MLLGNVVSVLVVAKETVLGVAEWTCWDILSTVTNTTVYHTAPVIQLLHTNN